jgi:hypothetical protein
VLAVFGDALSSSNAADFRAVTAILGKAPQNLIWDFPQFVQGALQAAAQLGEDSRAEMDNALWVATISGVRMGTPGQPFKEDIEQRDRSRQIASTMPQASPAEKFYLSMASAAEERIARDLGRDRVDDGREW